MREVSATAFGRGPSPQHDDQHDWTDTDHTTEPLTERADGPRAYRQPAVADTAGQQQRPFTAPHLCQPLNTTHLSPVATSTSRLDKGEATEGLFFWGRGVDSTTCLQGQTICGIRTKTMKNYWVPLPPPKKYTQS